MINIPDGTLVGHPDSGRLIEIYNPRWWRLDRWLRWLLARDKSKVTFYDFGGEATFRARPSKVKVLM